MKRMKSGKLVGPDDVAGWSCGAMEMSRRKHSGPGCLTLIPVFMNKEDVQSCRSYRRINEPYNKDMRKSC